MDLFCFIQLALRIFELVTWVDKQKQSMKSDSNNFNLTNQCQIDDAKIQ